MTSIVSSKARIGARCKIGDFVKIYDNVVLGDDSEVQDHCVLGLPSAAAQGADLVIGRNALVRPFSVIYQGSRFGNHFQTGTHVMIRELTQAGDGLRVGTGSALQGHNRFGNYVMLHSFVQVTQRAVVNDFAWLFPRVSFSDDPMPPSHLSIPVTVEEMAVVATAAVLMPGIRVGQGAFVAASSVVKNDVPAVTVVAGDPAKKRCMLRDLNLMRSTQNVGQRPHVGYPWHDHFADRYPDDAQLLLREVGERIRELMNAPTT